MHLITELLTASLAYVLYTRQFGWDLITLVRKVGIDMSSLGAAGISVGRVKIDIRMILDYLFACFLMTLAAKLLPIPGPMLFNPTGRTQALW